MTVHPLRPSDGTNRDRSHDEPIVDGGDPPPSGSRTDRLGATINEVDHSLDRYGSFDGGDHLAHRAVTPAMLSGLCRLELDLCRAFHAAMFGLLEDIGDADGMIATRGFFVDRGVQRMRAADAWLFHHPAPAADDDSHAAREAIADHSLALATAMGTNPNLTFASSAALRERLLDGVRQILQRSRVVSGQQIEWLTDLTLRLLAELDGHVVTLGDCRVWAAEEHPVEPHERPGEPCLDGSS